MNIKDGNPILYREVQTIQSLWFWGMILIPMAIIIYGMIQQLIFKIPWGNNPISNKGLAVIGLIVIIGLPLFLKMIRLEILVRDNGIFFRYAPFHFRFQRIPFENVKSYQIIQYRPLRDYGGWGIRYGKYGKVYSISGNTGFQIITSNQKKILLGTLNPNELKNAVDSIWKMNEGEKRK